MKLGWRKFVAVLLLGLVVVAGLSYWPQAHRVEPSFRGKSLTRWLKQLDDGEADGISSSRLPSQSASQLEAVDAIRAMGAQALPLLMQDLHLRPAENRLRFRIRRKIEQFFRRTLGIWLPPFGDVTEEDRMRWRAAQGLAALGPLARPAVPELERLLFTNFFHSSIKEAAYVLATIEPEGIRILTNAPQVDEWSGMCSIWALGQHPASGTNVIPFLVNATSSASEGTACGAIQVLGLFHTDPSRVIPALVSALSSPNPAVRSDAAGALGHFGAQAASAVPQLQGLAQDPVAGSAARAALKKISTPAAR